MSGLSEGSGPRQGASPTVATVYHGADTRRTGEHLEAGALVKGAWFDLNSAGDGDPLPVRVVSTSPSLRQEEVRIEFMTLGGERGETYLTTHALVAVMGSYDFEEEEW